MKSSVLILLALLLVNCKNGKQAVKQEPLGKKIDAIEVTEGCPGPEGSCSFEVMPGKGFHYEDDGSGKIRPKLDKNPQTMVIKFTFETGKDKMAHDGQYLEEVYAVIPADRSTIEAVDEELKNIKLTYGRFCFCDKKTVGYTKVDQGRFKIQNGQIRFRFQNGKFPQKTKEISGKF